VVGITGEFSSYYSPFPFAPTKVSYWNIYTSLSKLYSLTKRKSQKKTQEVKGGNEEKENEKKGRKDKWEQ
jgi:hypothetical protein